MTSLPEGEAGASVSQKSIELILLREVALRLTLPVVLYDAARKLVFLNRAAEELYGWRSDELGEVSQRSFVAMCRPKEYDGTPIPPERVPSGVALNWRRPKQREMWVYDAGGHAHWITVTGIPLDAQGGGIVGAMAIFWEIPGDHQPPPAAP